MMRRCWLLTADRIFGYYYDGHYFNPHTIPPMNSCRFESAADPLTSITSSRWVGRPDSSGMYLGFLDLVRA